jgi:hypothetical protein
LKRADGPELTVTYYTAVPQAEVVGVIESFMRGHPSGTTENL